MPDSKPTKIEKVQTLLERSSGVTLVEICKATGWQMYSARSATSGSRKAGCTTVQVSGEHGEFSINRILANTGADT